jgi:hypothetical protein
MYSGLQNGFFENLLIAEFFNCHNDIHSILHSQISSVVVFNDHDGVVDGQKNWNTQNFIYVNQTIELSIYLSVSI